MKDLTQKIDEFLKKAGIHPDLTDIGSTAKVFQDEMKRGLSGESSTLAMIPTYIKVGGTPVQNRPVIAIDAGGTNLRTCLVTFKDGAPVTEHMEKCSVPGSRGEVSVDEFFGFIADRILPLTDCTDVVGFCFSYPMEITPELDGIVQILTKELRVKDISGTHIGRTLGEKLRERGVKKPMHFVLLNDTVAGLMGGIACLGLSCEGGISGLILGTGCNTCYLERGENIKKLSGAADMIVNCESGNFGGAVRGEPDRRVDAGSNDPGGFLFEKMMSGAYMGKLVSEAIAMAVSEGLLSPAFENAGCFSTPEIDAFLRGEDGRLLNLCTGDDGEVITCIADAFFERAARLVCAAISALCLHCGGGKTEGAPFTVVAEGSMFWESLLFREKLEKHLREYTKGGLGLHVSICRAENSTLAGAALAALLNM